MSVRKKTEELISEDPSLSSSLERLLEIEESEGEILWSDVNSEITSGQWGRLIERGVLTEADDGEGFVISDTEAVEDVVHGGSSTSTSLTGSGDSGGDGVDTSWSTVDKAVAAVGAFFIFFGYSNATVQDAIGSTLNGVFAPLHTSLGLPYYIIILILATLTGLYSSFLQMYLMDWDWVNKKQEELKEIQSEMKEAQMGGDDAQQAQLQEEQKEMFSEQMDIMKMQFRPSIWIMVITIPIFIWLYWNFTSRTGQPMILETAGEMPTINTPFTDGAIEFNSTLIGPVQAWLGWYILCSFGLGQIMRKVLGVNPST
ncbi:DUF106 domain-containing protein [Halorutilales archaeon Cl-col2-1]